MWLCKIIKLCGNVSVSWSGDHFERTSSDALSQSFTNHPTVFIPDSFRSYSFNVRTSAFGAPWEDVPSYAYYSLDDNPQHNINISAQIANVYPSSSGAIHLWNDIHIKFGTVNIQRMPRAVVTGTEANPVANPMLMWGILPNKYSAENYGTVDLPSLKSLK